MLFGLTYLPTAQRLSFSVIKGANLRHEEVVERIEDFRKQLTNVKSAEIGSQSANFTQKLLLPG